MDYSVYSHPRSHTLQVDSLPAEPPGKPKNTGVCSLSVLQGIFPTQDSNWGLLHCQWILYQLSYQGSPDPKGADYLLHCDDLLRLKDVSLVYIHIPIIPQSITMYRGGSRLG